MLDALLLSNFKTFRELELPIGGLTLLTGLNSAGKSTVLQAFGVLRQSWDAGTLTDEDAPGLLLDGEFVQLGTGRDVLTGGRAETSSDDVRRDDTDDITLGIRSAEWSPTWAARYEADADLLPLRPAPPPSAPITPGELRDIPLFGDGLQYLKADRIFPAVSYPRSHQIAVRRGFLGTHGEHAANYLRHHRDEPVARDALHHPTESSPRLIRQVEAWMGEICPGVSLETEDVARMDTVRLSYRFGSGISESSPYRPTNVGFGLTYTLPIVVACLIAQPGSLILLENPEAHLHPRGQTQIAFLAARAAAAGAQVVLETHSDHVLNAMRLAVKQGLLQPGAVALHYFRREAGEVEVISPQVGPDGMLSEWPKGFFDEWDAALDALLD